jgi:hypothetical protein
MQFDLNVVGNDGKVIRFNNIKSNSPLKKLMNDYCDSLKVARSDVRFTFDGKRIKET